MGRTFQRLLSAFCALVIALSVCAFAQAARLTFPFDTIATDTVNMRRSASANAVILERVAKGDTVTVTGESGNYFKVTYKSRTGYILKTYLSTEAENMVTPAPTEIPVASGYPYETVTTDKVNLRSRASLYASILKKIPKGASVTVTKITGSWAAVTYGTRSGYVKKDYLAVNTVAKATRTPKPTAVPTPIPTLSAQENASNYPVLQAGSSGSAVRALQEALTELGFYSGKVTSTFDAATTEAVLAFQKKNKYPEPAIVDANLQAFLYSGKPLNSSGKKTSVNTLAPVAGVTVTSGKKGEFVGTIQLRLHELGYYSGTITLVYDAATRKAMKNFQKYNGLTANEICDLATQTVLFSDSAYANAAVTPTPVPTPAPTFQVPSDTVRRGSSGADAKLVQQRLKDLGYLTGKVDGKFGSTSVTALKAFQTKHNLTSDGIAGPSTYAILFSYNALARDEEPTPVPVTPTPVPTPTLVPTMAPITEDNVVRIALGVEDQAVLYLQTRLTQLGYYNATLDGICKADDVAAIKTFQQYNGLKVDGVAGYDTQVMLYSSSARTYAQAIATPAPTAASVTLKKGSRGEAVTDLQNRLIQLGYLFGKADGIYGTATAQAVAAFQAANKLSKDGVAGSRTLARLYSSSAVKPTATPAPTAKVTTAPSSSLLRRGDSSSAVKSMQSQLIALGFLKGKADGVFGYKTYQALLAFQRANRLKADGIAGTQTLSALASDNAVNAGGTTPKPTATPVPTAVPYSAAQTSSARNVIYANWYTTVRSVVKQFQYATIYDYKTGISWQVHIFSVGAHADAEPLSALDTAKMLRVFGEETWEPRAVWVILSNGSTYMASTHSHSHGVSHISTNNFAGHLCIHFPRTSAQVAAIGPYATSHQTTIDEGWAATQAMIR